MKKNRILYILLILLVIAMIALITLKINSNLKDNNKLSNITVSNIIFKDFSYDYDAVNDNTTFEFKIANNNANSVRLNDYIVLICDENNNLIDIYKFNNSYILKENGISNAGFSIDIEFKDNYIIKIELPELEKVNNDIKGDIDVS